MITKCTGATRLQIEMCHLTVLVKIDKSKLILVCSPIERVSFFGCIFHTHYMLVLLCTIRLYVILSQLFALYSVCYLTVLVTNPKKVLKSHLLCTPLECASIVIDSHS